MSASHNWDWFGGSKDACMVLGKRAACLRIVGDQNPDPKIANLEQEFKELGNSIGMGAMGFVGKSMVIDCNIEVGFCHTGGMQMSVHAFCLSSRRAVARIFPNGESCIAQILSGILRIKEEKLWTGRRAQNGKATPVNIKHKPEEGRVD